MKTPMLRSALAWLGFGQADSDHSHDHSGQGGHHGHTHGVVDPTIATTERGIWAIKWSFVILAVTAALQFAVVIASGSVALLADTIHNVGDAVTAVPLWIAFAFARRKPSSRFTYGYGRVEDLAGIAIVLIILFSAIVAAYEAIDRLIHPQPLGLLGWVALAGLVGFIGNEVVAVFRIRVGREIQSAALIADGYHARTDGLTSLAVVVGAAGVWLGFPLADPIIGLLITVAIFGIVWQSVKAVFTRVLDGVEPGVVAEIRHAAEHVPAIRQVLDVRARWLGHRLHADLDLALDSGTTVAEAEGVTSAFEKELAAHIPALSTTRIRARAYDPAQQGTLSREAHHSHAAGHHHAPEPVPVRGELAEGILEIIDTPEGERMRFTASRPIEDLDAAIVIKRPGGMVETLSLMPNSGNRFVSSIAPAEPHEFDAELRLQSGGRAEVLAFKMVEPADHAH